MTFTKWEDYRPDERHWIEKINPWLFAALLIALYALACFIGTGCETQAERERREGDKKFIAQIARADSVDLIETREDIVYRLLDAPNAPIGPKQWADSLHPYFRAKVDEVLKRDFATWPMAPGAKKGAGGILDSGGPSDTTRTLTHEDIRKLVTNSN